MLLSLHKIALRGWQAFAWLSDQPAQALTVLFSTTYGTWRIMPYMQDSVRSMGAMALLELPPLPVCFDVVFVSVVGALVLKPCLELLHAYLVELGVESSLLAKSIKP